MNDKKKRPRKQSKEPLINALHSIILKDIDLHWKTTSLTKDNLSKRERKVLQRLKNRKDIVIKKADKGEATVVLDSKDCLEEGLRQLNEETAFCDLVHHVVRKGLNFEKDLEIVIIEQLKSQANLTKRFSGQKN